MITIVLLIVAFASGNLFNIIVVMSILAFFWIHIIVELKSKNHIHKYNKIDKYCDENYADINWLKKRKM